MATERGKALCWTTAGFTFTGFAAGEPTGELQSLQGDRTSEKKSVMDGNGDDIAEYYHNAKRNLNFTVVPSAATKAAAAGNIDKYLAPPGTIVTSVDTKGTGFAATHSGKYNLQSCSVRLTNNGEAVVDVSLQQGDTNDLAVSPS